MKFTNIFINTISIIILVLITIVISTISITNKYNQFRRNYVNGVTATVIKQEIPVYSFTQGVVTEVFVEIGSRVKQEDVLLTIDNPAIRERISTLSEFKDNLSAQTEARVAESQLKFLNVTSPVDGIVSDVFVRKGVNVDDTTVLVEIFSNEGIKLLADLSQEQFSLAQGMSQIEGFSSRLNQRFILVPETLKPEVKVTSTNTKKIGLYLAFKNPESAVALLQNEDIIIRLRQLDNFNRPIDAIARFWNSVLGTKYE